MTRRLILLFRSCLVLTLLGAFGRTLLAGEHPPSTAGEVWQGYDLRKEPLEVKLLKQWVEHGSILTEFTFTGMPQEGSKLRVSAVGSKSGEIVPTNAKRTCGGLPQVL